MRVEGSWAWYFDARASNSQGNQLSQSTFIFTSSFIYSHPLPDQRSPWTIFQISPSRKSLTWLNQDHTRKESIDHPLCLLMLVSIQPTFICTEARSTTGVVVVILKIHHSVMVNASGSWLDAVLYSSTFLNLDIISFATVRCQLMHHFAMEHINSC